LSDRIMINGASTAWLTASLFNLLVDENVTCMEGLRYVLCGGERVSVPHFRRFLESVPETTLIHTYGPCENSCLSTFHPVDRCDLDDPRGIPIGTTIPGVSAWILDEDHRECPVETPGELYLGGTGLTLGYIGLPELNRERFLDLPIAGQRRHVYRSGDRFVRGEDGLLRFLGRVDRQVKLRGQRVELDGVEAAIRRIEGVRNVAVVPSTDPAGTVLGLTAYVVASPDTTTEGIRRRAHAVLPPSHVPTRLLQLPSLPLTASGKVDYAVLRAAG
jgi:non-ribosomal peptide synthetase component F